MKNRSDDRSALTSPFLARSAGEEGGRGEGEGTTLTPSPAPALRERGDLVGGLGIVARHRRRIATAPLTSPFLARSAGEEGGRGEGEGASRNVLNQASVPPSLSQTRPQTGQH